MGRRKPKYVYCAENDPSTTTWHIRKVEFDDWNRQWELGLPPLCWTSESSWTRKTGHDVDHQLHLKRIVDRACPTCGEKSREIRNSKKIVRIPFDAQTGAQIAHPDLTRWKNGERVPAVWKDNIEFRATVEVLGTRDTVRSGKRFGFQVHPEDGEPFEAVMFSTETATMLRQAGTVKAKPLRITGLWTFRKRGENYSLQWMAD